MSGIFISYRRSGASVMAYRIADELKRNFGSDSLFLDVESIDPGVPFAQAIQNSLNRCSVALIVMGPEWLNMTDDQGRRRLDNPDDWVRQEVRLALESKLRVIPVLVKGAFMPSPEDLPSDIQRLASLHAFSFIDSQTHWSFDVQRLQDQISEIDKRLAKKRQSSSSRDKQGASSYSYKAIVGLFMALLFLMGTAGGADYFDNTEVYGALFVIMLALLLCFLGWKDIRAGLKKGMGFAIGGGVMSILAMLITAGELSFSSVDHSSDVLTTNHSQEKKSEPQIQPTEPSINNTLEVEPEPVRPQVVNIAGNWISEEGVSYIIRQNGETFSFVEKNLFGVQVGQGQGRVQGNQIAYTYHNSLINVSGQGSGSVNNDVMSLYFTDQYNNALYYEVYRQ